MPISVEYQQVAQIERFSCNYFERQVNLSSLFDESQVELNQLNVGATIYPFRKTLSGKFVRALEELIVDGVSPMIVGQGKSPQDAIEDFAAKFHGAFQELLFARPFEMNDDEKKMWRMINDVIDVTVYQNSTPIIVRQFGEIRWGTRSYPSAIVWDNGFTEPIRPCDVDSPDFITFKPGQPVEAVVARDPLTRRILHIPFITRVRGLRTPKQLAESRLNERIGTSADLPNADWD